MTRHPAPTVAWDFSGQRSLSLRWPDFDIDEDVRAWVLDYLNADPGIEAGRLFWLAEGQLALIVIRQPVQ